MRKRLNQYQQDVISICQEYDAIVAKQTKSRTDYLQTEQFNLIKKAVSTITCLEDLVNVSLVKIEKCDAEVKSAMKQVQNVGNQNAFFKE